MSNPFATFRKNQKYWMAALVLVAIFAFIIAPVFDYAQQAIGGGSADNSVAVRWNTGRMTLGDLQNAVRTHNNLVRFLSEVASRVLEQGGRPNVPGFQQDPQSGQIISLGIQVSSDPVSIVRTRLLADRGKAQGVEFDDDAVDQFLYAYVDNKLSSEEVAEILRETSGGTMSYFEVREMLKGELCATVLQRTAWAGIFAENRAQFDPLVTPGKAFNDFLKINQAAKVEAFPVFVDDYLGQVESTPSEAEVQQIYDSGSLLASNPDSPDPGFLRRYHTNVEYVEANLQEWIDREKAKLTEEQLREEYDRRVELGQLQVPVTSAAEPTQESEGEQPAGSESAQPTSDQPVGDVQAEANESPQNPTEADDTAASDPSQDPPPPADAPAESDQSSSPASSHSVRFVSFLQDENAAAESDRPIPPPIEQPPQLGELPRTSTDSGDEPLMRTQTFEEARDSIADSLAREAAIPALDNELTGLFEDVMRPYFGQYRQYQAFLESGLKEENGETREAPVKPDLKKLASERGLKWGETGLVDGVTLVQTPFGQGNIRPDESGVSGSVANVVMNPGVPLFQPMQSSYFDQAALQSGRMPDFLQYLLWKTEQRQAYIPELEEVRGEVVDAWKRLKARQLADNAARDLAKKVSGSGEDPWAEALSGTEKALVIETAPFAWIRMDNSTGFMSVSPVDKLDRVGGEFMRAVFTSPVGQVAVAPNANHDVYYVFRVTELTPSQEELEIRFNADPLKMGPRRIAMEENQRLFATWFDNLEQEMGLQWQMDVGQFVE